MEEFGVHHIQICDNYAKFLTIFLIYLEESKILGCVMYKAIFVINIIIYMCLTF